MTIMEANKEKIETISEVCLEKTEASLEIKEPTSE
jgi:hypothetical protein